jgi:hypothetical protein
MPTDTLPSGATRRSYGELELTKTPAISADCLTRNPVVFRMCANPEPEYAVFYLYS